MMFSAKIFPKVGYGRSPNFDHQSKMVLLKVADGYIKASKIQSTGQNRLKMILKGSSFTPISLTTNILTISGLKSLKFLVIHQNQQPIMLQTRDETTIMPSLLVLELSNFAQNDP